MVEKSTNTAFAERDVPTRAVPAGGDRPTGAPSGTAGQAGPVPLSAAADGTPVTAIAFTADPAMSFWPTPPQVADDLVYRALVPGFGDGGAGGDVPPVRVLEPSAGEGHLLRAVRKHLPRAHVSAVEPSLVRARRLREDGLADEVIEATLEDYLAAVSVAALADGFLPFDLVVMNPPFTLPDRPEAWAQHFLNIYNDPYLLAPYGQISAVVPRIVVTGRSKLVRQVRALLHPYFGVDLCERGAFDAVGARVSAAMIWVEKPPADQLPLANAAAPVSAP